MPDVYNNGDSGTGQNSGSIQNPILVPQQGFNLNAQPFVPPQQSQHPVPQPLVVQGFNPNAQPFVPQQAFNPNAQPFVPQQGFNPNAQPFVPPPPPPYPVIPNGFPVDPALLNSIQGLPVAQGPYQIMGTWHANFEGWAAQLGINGGWISHFNIQAANGPMLHVYYNAYQQLQVVGVGQQPAGY